MIHPVVADVKIITDVPAETPVTIPPPTEPGVTVATLLVTLVQVPPPAVGLVNTVVDPTHTVIVPTEADGNALTVTVVVLEHPVPNE